MLTVGKVGPANAGYYESAVVRGAEDYYAGDGDAPGRWIGRSDWLGLSPAVDIESELEDWVSGFVDREGRSPTAAETGKAHKTIVRIARCEVVQFVGVGVQAEQHLVAVPQRSESLGQRFATNRRR